MRDGSNNPLSNPLLMLAVLVIAIICVMVATVALNGGTSTAPVEVEETNTTDIELENDTSPQSTLIGNNSYGTVSKISNIGNSSSNVKVALIVGVDQKEDKSNSIVSTLQNEKDLKYCYDIYMVNATKANKNSSDENNENSLSVNNMSEQLANEYVVPDVINNNYNFTVDIHYTNDSNSYVFVPSENTYTSKKVVESISNNTNIGNYTPPYHSFTDLVSDPILKHEIPSIVYVTTDYYSNGTSNEVSGVISAIDNFDFEHLFDSDDSNNQSSDSNSSYSSGNSSSNSSSSYDDSYSTYSNDTYSSSNSSYSKDSGNKEV